MNKGSEDVLTNYEINNIYEFLLQNIMVGDEIKEKHINDIRKRLG